MMMKKKLFLLCLLCLFTGIAANAYDFVLNGIYYTITSSKTVAVDQKSSSGNSYSGNVVIPSRVSYNSVQYDVTSIASGAFDRCSGLTSVTIPNSITSIGQRGFIECSGLTSIELPAGLTNLAEYAFEGCLGLTSVTIPNGITTLSHEACI